MEGGGIVAYGSDSGRWDRGRLPPARTIDVGVLFVVWREWGGEDGRCGVGGDVAKCLYRRSQGTSRRTRGLPS